MTNIPMYIEKDIAFAGKSRHRYAVSSHLWLKCIPMASGLEHYDLGYLETLLEGQYRPGHFQGVCLVMAQAA